MSYCLKKILRLKRNGIDLQRKEVNIIMGDIADKIEGIGPSYENKLITVGIKTIEDLQQMNIDKTSEKTGISQKLLRTWQSMAILQQIEGIGSQFSEVLVKMGITNIETLMQSNPEEIQVKIEEYQKTGIIPNTATIEEIRGWQETATQIIKTQMGRPPKIPDEVSKVWETMTCRGMRNYYEKLGHPCMWFSQFGPFHAYDVNVEDAMSGETGYVGAVYAGRRYQIPELLSGCRKAPIMSVGLNPNLRAVTDPQRIYPFFDDIQQYAKHFRYRTTYKYSIEDTDYETHFDATLGDAVFKEKEPINLFKEYVSMYKEYEKILNTFASRVGVTDSKLCLGEDVSYYNFVACHSPRWNMDTETEEGIIQECYHSRRFFLKQLIQSMPRVIMIFGKSVMRSFVKNFYNTFEEDNIPDTDETYSVILSKNNYVMRISGERVRVIFSPHPTGARPWYIRLDAMAKIVDALSEEYQRGSLIYDEDIRHFKRTGGSCKFCDNDTFFIGRCNYTGFFEKEDTRPTEEISGERQVIADELEASGK